MVGTISSVYREMFSKGFHNQGGVRLCSGSYYMHRSVSVVGRETLHPSSAATSRSTGPAQPLCHLTVTIAAQPVIIKRLFVFFPSMFHHNWPFIS